jgi:hypothetical protein
VNPIPNPDPDPKQALVFSSICVFITAVPITKLFAWGRGIVEDMCYERRRAEACVG